MIYGNNDLIRAVSVARTYDATVSASTEVTFNSASTLIQVTAITAPILLKWGVDDASTSAFDAVISPNESLWFNIPVQTSGAIYTAANFIQTAVNAILIVVEY